MPTHRFITPLGAMAVIGLAVVAGLAWAQEPPADAAPAPVDATTTTTTTAAPSAAVPEPTTEERMRQARLDAIAGLPGVGGDDDRLAPSEEEWQAAAKAMEELTPNWWRRFGRAPQEGPGRERMKRSIVNRYRELQHVRQRDPEQYQREVEQLKLEDDVLSFARSLAREPQREDAPELKRQLREAVGRLVDLRIRNREARIARLLSTLEKERGRLEADKQNRETIAERQYEAVLNRRPGPGLPGPGGTPPGGRRGPGGPVGPPERPGFAAPPPPGFPGERGERPRPGDGRSGDEAPVPPAGPIEPLPDQ